MLLPWVLLLSLASVALSSTNNDTLFWGPYRPNLYFGLRPRIPQSLMTGLMWFGTHDYASISRTRHTCEQGDELQSYTWTQFDPREGGVQVIKDATNNVEITTEFLKQPGGDHGGSWAARIKGKPLNPALPSRISTVFYFGLEGLGGIDMETDEDEDGIEGEVKFSGSTPELDDFVLRVADGPNNVAVTHGRHSEVFEKRIGKTHFLGVTVPPGNIWKAKGVVSISSDQYLSSKRGALDFILQAIIQRAQGIVEPYRDPAIGAPDPSFVLQLPDEIYTGSNLHAVQKLFDGEFQFDVYFESASAKQRLSSSVVTQGIAALSEKFNERFKSTFPKHVDYSTANNEALEKFSQAITSNLMGGVGYFYGNSLVNKKFSYEWDEDEDAQSGDDDEEENGDPKLTEPKELLTATPSRSFFPRGFYWDEGFHLLHIGAWDNDFSVEILKHWIGLIDEDGWVAREQILGEEARSKGKSGIDWAVGPRPRHGLRNGGAQTPLAGESTALDATNQYLDPEVALSFLKSIYNPLKRHYDWFRRTQRGQIKQYGRKARSRSEAYRWRGRSETHVLTSGMDDYPRGPPHPGELHLDLISWMAFFSRTMREISSFVGENDDAMSYAEIEKAILDNIEDLHWNEEQQMYCDVNVDNEGMSSSYDLQQLVTNATHIRR
ncbi:Processing alpha glucosidase I [Paramarasmius palmivorus]|uniref:Mannosyl-oligosaccharide glucosidase n=1 Tax=Paramarasmius palmivorus TaxID=297713 RepID=A0AAW0CZF7_9AGAR